MSAPDTLSAIAAALPWQQFICRACGLVYDEALGDADSGLAPGTRFADIPEDWACPLCGVTKRDFELYEQAPARSVQGSPAASGRVVAPRGLPGTVIVGAGRAGWRVAEELRAADPACPITLVTACAGGVYDKPMLSVAMARDLSAAQLLKESGAVAARRLRVRLVAHTDAIRVLPASRLLRTTRGTYAYRHLVLAHGSQSRSLPGLPASLCWHINHLEAYEKFRAALGPVPQCVAVVGAGLIGAELANDLALGGHHVTLLDVQDRPLAACITSAQSAALLQAWRPLLLQFAGGVHVHEVLVTPGGRQVRAHDGRAFDADHIVVAAGLQTAGRLAASAGLAWDNGVAVDGAGMQTSVPGIYALGDCVSIDGLVSRYIEPIGRQARAIAAGILGRPVPPYRVAAAPVRVKTTSHPFTLAAAH